MKIKQEKEVDFKPIKITLETLQEATIIKALLNWSPNDLKNCEEYYPTINKAINSKYILKSDYKKFIQLKDQIWEELNKMGVEF